MKNYIISITISAIICAVARSLLSEKTATGQFVRLLTGILMTITIIAPLTKISFNNVTDYLSGVSIEADYYVSDGKIIAQEAVCGIINEQTEAYILDKANSMGLDISVEVELDDSNYSVPSKVKIIGNISPYAKEVIGMYIEEKLGIAKEYQQWI